MALLDRFFKPKWQHPNPQVRKQALQTLDAKDPVLLQLAREDEDPGLRRAALGRLNDLQLMQQIAREDNEAGVREYAQARFRKLMLGNDSDSPGLEQRLDLLKQVTSAELVEYIAAHAAEAELRLQALCKVQTPSLFADLAIADPAAKVRTAALERVEDPADLERIARQARNRDKRISKIARERLQAQRSERQRSDSIQQVCIAMENLNWDGETGPAAARFVKLEEQWRDLEASAPDDIRQRYQQAHAQFFRRLQESAGRRAARQTLCRSLQEQIEQLQNKTNQVTEDPQQPAGQIQALVESTVHSWSEIGDIDVYDLESQRLQRQFEQLCQTLRTSGQRLRHDHEQLHQRQAVLKAADELLQQAGQVLEADVNELRQRWQRLPRLDNPVLLRDLQTRFEHQLERLQTRLQHQAQQKGQELATLQELLEQLEQALDAGELQQAIDLDGQARENLRSNISLSRHQMARLQERLQDSAATINRLRSWRRWGTNQVRENLCEEIESMIGVSDNPLDRSRLIRAARTTWKNLDGTEGVAPRPLWKRFNDACERAYEPCRDYFDTQAKERLLNLEKRTALCVRLENFIAETDWDDTVDWRHVGQFERDMQKQWRKLGVVNRSDRKAIEQRYQTALQQLQDRLKPQLERDLQRRRGLIKQVEQLIEHDDLNEAIERVKHIQTQWQPEVLASKRREQTLWKQFRAACDAIFERRQAAREVMDAERQANLEQKTALCERIEQLTHQLGEQAVSTVVQARAEIDQIQQQWDTIGSVPKNALRTLERRFNTARNQFEQNCLRQERLEKRAEMEGLKQRASLCRQLETLLSVTAAGKIAGDLAQIRRQWDELPSLKSSLTGPLDERFSVACHAADVEADRASLVQSLHDNQTKKQQLCLRMEIAAGSETPPEFAQQRLEYQVARLSESMVERRAVTDEEKARAEAQEIEREWYATGVLPSDQDQRLEQRFQQALKNILD
jgi:hypothetical protein